MKPVSAPSSSTSLSGQPVRHLVPTLRKALLSCGIGASVLYAVMNIYVPMQWEGYSVASRTVSELSAIGAPTRSLWAQMAAIYTVLLIAFGCGVWLSATTSKLLRFVGGVIVAQCVVGVFWPPMHQREVLAAGGGTLTDTLHIVFTAVWGLISMLAIVAGGLALGKRFRLYSFATLAVLLVCGFITSLDAPKMQANLPTPWMGVWERINIGSYLLWLVVFAVALWRLPMKEET